MLITKEGKNAPGKYIKCWWVTFETEWVEGFPMTGTFG